MGKAFLGGRGLNRPFRDGHHITRSQSSGIPFPIRRLELPHVAAEVIVASSGAAIMKRIIHGFEVDWASDRVFAELASSKTKHKHCLT